MKFREPAMEEYFASLPPAVKNYIDQSGVEVSTYGELMQIGEHFKHSLDTGKSQVTTE